MRVVFRSADNHGVPVCAYFGQIVTHPVDQFYRLVLDAKLSELSSRTIEMEHAATKADGMLAKIRHDFARERRAASTLKQLSSYQVSQML